MNQFLVINGNPVDGYTYHGTFNTNQQAYQWGIDNFDESGFHVVVIRQVNEAWHDTHEASQNNT